MRAISTSIFLVLAIFSHPATSIEVREYFEGTKDDLLKTWNPCQADFEHLIEVKSNVLVNIIDAVWEGSDNCSRIENDSRQLMEDESDRLGPSFITSRSASSLKEGESCAREILNNGKTISQKNELRFLGDDRFNHNFTDPHWYAIRFKMDKDIPTCGSVRWVNAQWKYKDDDWEEGLVPSPFLAQRFDNGVLHLTVQNGHCRCMIAKAPGDPDRVDKRIAKPMDEAVPDDAELAEVWPLGCKWSEEGPQDGARCCPKEKDFKLLARRAEDLLELPDPKKDWVRMAYWIQGAKGPNRTIDVWANGRFVVRIKGMIGYPGGKPRNVKFKFGAYRDKFKYGPPKNAPPDNAHMLVDEICVTKSKEKAVSGCR